MRFFPKVDPAGPIGAEVRASAVDYVNRVNWLFETWDLPGMIASFTSDARIVHFHGTLSGEDDVRHFLTEHYPYLVPGVGRCACNHIVDMEASGLVAVRYQNLLVRYAAPEDAPKLSNGQVDESDDLPVIWLYSPMLDRLRKTDDGWKIAERYIGGSTFNRRFTPLETSAEAVRQYLPGGLA
ncbi:nuclear transport factor 2 family protein [Cupriavidus lacunae]|uniref:Nuclear transport factor 2 family protein n=1 Tax=Cupriavidus lacunae TaxID=2666307 RepID=A0A370N9Q0_9BURK|nr:nuclear transport factor 2 family protein [Cupriavidus lacunae]RDK02258.1 nuclear transport factor 2 family protein [Cupriavidus lacunae]